MAYKLAQLRALSDEELIREYDRIAETTNVGLDFYANELARRTFEVQNRRIESLTGVMTWMTGAILVLTIINVVLVWLSLK